MSAGVEHAAGGLRLYDYLPSGNGYKARLLFAKLGIAYELVLLDIKRGESRTPEFLAKNPNGRIPIVEFADGRVLAESHAILGYFGEGSALVPDDAFERARMWQWMCFEQYSLEPFIGTLRFWRASLGQSPEAIGGARYDEKIAGGHAALGVLEDAVAAGPFVLGDRMSLADLALYAYSHVAEEGDFELARFPRVQAWHARVAAEPGHVAIDARP